MISTDIIQFLKEVMGLDVSTVGPSAIERGLRERMQECCTTSAEEYLRLARSDLKERQELIEAVAVPETSFFRDRESFNGLSGLIMGEWLAAHPAGKLRVLSIPCSTGEEPYTIVMALLDAGMPSGRLEVHAADISHRSIRHARRAVYGRNSFRSVELAYRDRYFEPHANHSWQLRQEVRDAVRFHQGNVLEVGFLTDQPAFDVIFCRNLLIYFDVPTQELAIRHLVSRLVPGGFLFVGPAEASLLLQHEFTPLKLPLSFAFRQGRRPPKSAPVLGGKPSSRERPSAATKGNLVERPRHQAVVTKAKTAARPVELVDVLASLESARLMADAGKLKEAAAACELFQATHGPTAESCFLLGVIRDAEGKASEAAALYRKAVYMDPKHPGALLNLALSCERTGGIAEARRLRDRARRAGEVVKHG